MGGFLFHLISCSAARLLCGAGGAAGVVLSIAACAAGGCAYSAGTSLPKELRTVWVPVMGNETRERGLEAEVTAAVVAEFQTEGSLRPAPKEKADCVLKGTIRSYTRNVIRKSGQGSPLVRQVKMELRMDLEVAATGEKVIGPESVSSTDTDRTAGYFRIDSGESESLGRERAVRALAKAVVRSVVEHW